MLVTYTNLRYLNIGKKMKFRKATKKIVAVASAAALVSSGAFAVPNYPMNFVQNDVLTANVVVGSDAAASDMTAAQTIVDELNSMADGGTDMVTITYREAGAGGESVPIRDAGTVVKLGSDLGQVKTTDFNDRDLSILRDETLRVGNRNRDYTQSIDIHNGSFEHTLRDRLEDEMSQKIYLPRNVDLMSYTLDFNTEITNTSFDTDVLQGEEIVILGNTYTIAEADWNNGRPSMKLLGGANKIALGEGQSTSVTVDGTNYEIRVNNVDTQSERVLLEVNGQVRTINEFASDEIAGVNIVVTNLVGATGRDIVGYAEIVVGGDEIIIEHGEEVELNDEKISREIPDYYVETEFDVAGGTVNGMTFKYQWRGTNGVIIRAGESYEDQLFNAFGIMFEGTNDVEYTETRLVAGRDTLSVETVLVDGTVFNRDIAFAEEYDVGPGTSAAMRLIGDSRDVPMLLQTVDFSSSSGTVENVSGDVGSLDAIYNVSVNGNLIFAGEGTDVERLFYLGSGLPNATHSTQPVSGIRADVVDLGLQFLAERDEDLQYLYTITGFSRDSANIADDEYTILDQNNRGASSQRFAAGNESDSESITGRLPRVDNFEAFRSSNTDETVIRKIGFDDAAGTLSLEREGRLNISELANSNLADGTSRIYFMYDVGDLRIDEDEDAGIFVFEAGWDTSDDNVEIRLLPNDDDGNIVDTPPGAKAYVSTSNRDVFQRVDAYGTIVQYDNDRRDEVIIVKPNRQLEANVVLTTGTMGALREETVSASQAEARVAELEAQGATIVGQSTQAGQSVTVNVAAPLTDLELTDEIVDAGNHIVVGGPAVNAAARLFLGIDEYDVNNPEDVAQAGVNPGEFVHRYFEDLNSVVVYGYSAEDTTAAVRELNQGSANFE